MAPRAAWRQAKPEMTGFGFFPECPTTFEPVRAGPVAESWGGERRGVRWGGRARALACGLWLAGEASRCLAFGSSGTEEGGLWVPAGVSRLWPPDRVVISGPPAPPPSSCSPALRSGLRRFARVLCTRAERQVIPSPTASSPASQGRAGGASRRHAKHGQSRGEAAAGRAAAQEEGPRYASPSRGRIPAH